VARQIQVCELIMKGWSNKQIADELQLAEQTVKDKITAIFKELKVGSRAEAIVQLREAKRDGLAGILTGIFDDLVFMNLEGELIFRKPPEEVGQEIVDRLVSQFDNQYRVITNYGESVVNEDSK